MEYISPILLGINPVTLVSNNPYEARKLEQVIRTLSMLICNPSSILQTTAALKGSRLVSLFIDLCLNENIIITQRTAELDAELQDRVGVSPPPPPPTLEDSNVNNGFSDLNDTRDNDNNNSNVIVNNASNNDRTNAFYNRISNVCPTARVIIRDYKRNVAAEILLIIIGEIECLLELAIRSPSFVRFTQQTLGFNRTSSRRNGWIIVIAISCIKAIINLFLHRRSISEVIMSIKGHLTNVARSIIGRRGKRLSHYTSNTDHHVEMTTYKGSNINMDFDEDGERKSSVTCHSLRRKVPSPGLVIPKVVVAPTTTIQNNIDNSNTSTDKLGAIRKYMRPLISVDKGRVCTGNASGGDVTYLRNNAEYLGFLIDMLGAVHPALWAILAYIYRPNEHFHVNNSSPLPQANIPYGMGTITPNLFPTTASVSPLFGSLQPSWSVWRLMFLLDLAALVGSLWIRTQPRPIVISPIADYIRMEDESNNSPKDDRPHYTYTRDDTSLGRIRKCQDNVLKWALRDPYFSIVLKDFIRDHFVYGCINRYVPLVGGMIAGQVEYFLKMQQLCFLYTTS